MYVPIVYICAYSIYMCVLLFLLVLVLVLVLFYL
jgi:hypothetical protein